MCGRCVGGGGGGGECGHFFKTWILRVAKAGEFLDPLPKGQDGCEISFIE